MGVDYYFSLGYGFMLPNVKNMEELEALEDLIGLDSIIIVKLNKILN